VYPASSLPKPQTHFRPGAAGPPPTPFFAARASSRIVAGAVLDGGAGPGRSAPEDVLLPMPDCPTTDSLSPSFSRHPAGSERRPRGR